jgi:hypothetical protein
MKKYLSYLAIVSILFMGVSVYAQEDVQTTSEKSEQNKEVRHEGEKGLRERALEMRTKMEDKLKERSEKIKSGEAEGKNIDIMCAQTAVDARDTAVIAAFDTYSTSMKTALEARKTAVKDAWSKTTSSERNTARKTANQTYNTASRNAHKALNTSRKSIWAKHKTDMKACGAGAGIDQMGQQMEGGLSL